MCWLRTISSSTFITSDVQSIYAPSQIQDWYQEDKIQAGKDRRYSLRLWIPWIRITKIRMRLTWKHHVLHGASRKSGEDIKTRCTGSIYNLLNRKDWSSIKQDRTQSSITTHSQLIVSRKLLWWNLEKSFTRKNMRHLDLLQRFLLKIIGWKNWIQKLLEAAKTSNESNQNQKPNYQERGDPWVSNHQVRSLRRSEKKSCLVAKTQTQERWKHRHSARVVCQCLLNL